VPDLITVDQRASLLVGELPMLAAAVTKLRELKASSDHLNDVFDVIEELQNFRDELDGTRCGLDSRRRRLAGYIWNHQKTKSYESGDRREEVASLQSKIGVCEREMALLKKRGSEVDREIAALVEYAERSPNGTQVESLSLRVVG
jgi:hypothetical protein